MATSSTPTLFTKLARLGALGAIVVAVFVWPVSWVVAGQARTLQFIAPFEDAIVEVNRFEYEDDATGKDKDIIQIYGAPLGDAEAVVFVDASKIIHPLEKPELALLKVDKEAGDNPLQLGTVRFLTRAVSFGAFATAAGFAVLLLVLRRRRAAGAATP